MMTNFMHTEKADHIKTKKNHRLITSKQYCFVCLFLQDRRRCLDINMENLMYAIDT